MVALAVWIKKSLRLMLRLTGTARLFEASKEKLDCRISVYNRALCLEATNKSPVASITVLEIHFRDLLVGARSAASVELSPW